MENLDFLREEYFKLEEAFLKVSDEAELTDFRQHITAQALHMWSSEPGYHQDYGQALSVIYDGAALKKESLQDIMEQVRHKEYLAITPAFIKMVATEAKDEKRFGKIGRNFISNLVTFLTDLAFVNGDCTVAEANAIEKTREVYMDFYNRFMENINGVCSGLMSPGKFKYKNYGAEIDYAIEESCRAGAFKEGSFEETDFDNVASKGISGIDMSVFELADRLDLRGKIQHGTEKTAAGQDTPSLNLPDTEMIGKTVDIIEKMVREGLGEFGDIGDIKAPALGEIEYPESADVTKKEINEQKTESKEETTKEVEQTKATQTEEESEKSFDELMEEMDNLVGLDAVKKDIHSMINFLKVCQLRKERGLKAPELSHHMVFSGNPGTGKTTIARLLSKMYKQIGLLENGQLVEVDRSGLIAAYQGQTAIKTAEVVQSALGGVLFIDEAYSLVQEDNDSYGKECIATVLKAMEDHRDKLVVIVAGYDDLMNKFIESNPGLKSRFNKYVHFPDYTGEEMEKIFLLQCKSNGYKLEEEAQKIIREVFDKMYEMRNENFGNGRTVRNTFEKVINCQATRLASANGKEITDDELVMLTAADVKEAMEMTI